MYDSNGGFSAVYLPAPIDGVVALGRQSNNDTHYTIIMQDSRYILWGYYGSPANMTERGKKVFVNTVNFTPFRLLTPILKVTLVPFLPTPTP
jgi:hypothetical protein